MKISRFRTFDDNRPSPIETDWDGFCANVIGTEHTLFPGDKKKTPAFSPAEYEANATRSKANVKRVWLGVLDYDGISIERLQEIEAQLRSEPATRFAAYTSYSHVTGKTARIRLVLDLDRPVTPEEWPHFWEKLAAVMADPSLDTSCKDASRIYGLPYTPSPEQGLIINSDGLPICVDEVLELDTPEAVAGQLQRRERTQTITRDELKRYAARLERRLDSKSAEMGRWLLQIAEGEPYAFQGSRHNTGMLVTLHLERNFPNVPIDELARLFEGSHRAMGTTAEQPELEQDITNSLQTARDKRQVELVGWQAEQEERNKQNMRDAFGNGRTDPYTQAELKTFADEAGVSLAGFQKRWMIQYQRSFYAYVNGKYWPARHESDMLTTVRDALAPAKTGGVELEKMNERGQRVNKGRDDLCREYATVAGNVVASFLEPKSRYDAETGTFYESVAPLRDIKPEHSEYVEKWLQLMAGEEYENLCLWLKLCFDLREPLCVLFLEGSKSVGKTLFANALSRAWSKHGPTSANAATADFNSAITGNPLIFADEYMPDAWRKNQGLSRLREFIAARQRDLNRKFLPRVPIMGAVRIILAANNDEILKTFEQLGQNDRDAIAERFRHIRVDKAAATYLKSLTKERIDSIAEGDEMVRHVAWLRDNYPVERKGRFGLEPQGQAGVLSNLKHSQPDNAAVAEWLIGFLLKPKRYWDANPAENKLHARFHEGKLLVNMQALKHVESWKLYVSNPDKPPGAYRLGRAMADLACDERCKIGTIQYRSYDFAKLWAMAKAIDLAGEAEITEALANGTK